MERHLWVVSDPPHGDEVDLDEAAAILGLTKAEARIKINFWAPEVWLAYADREQASETVDALGAAGLEALVLPGSHLLRVPPPEPVRSFAFEEEAFVAHLADRHVRVPYDARVVGVFTKPPPDFLPRQTSSGSGTASPRTAVGQRSTSIFVERLTGGHRLGPWDVAEALERRTNLDLYLTEEGRPLRISIAQGVVDFSGLGDAKRPRASDNMAALVEELRRRCERIRLDTRLENVRPRRRLTVGGPVDAAETRKLYSFGTVALEGLLKSVSPELAAITQYELGSRIAYLMITRADEASAWVQ